MTYKTNLDNGIAELCLDYPPVNAFNGQGWIDLSKEINNLSSNDEVRVVIIRSNGKGFCAGVDIKELAEDSNKIVEVNRGCYESFKAVRACNVPVISAVHGFCLGGGVGLVGASDIIIASDDAYFGLPEVDRGALGAASHLARMFPLQHVRRMMFTAEPIDALEAYRLGALEKVVSKDNLLSSAMSLANKIAEKSPLAIRLAKESLNGIESHDVDKSYLYEQGFTLKLYESDDSTEARKAFVEKREADFKD
ncbi:MAG: enoyl-CoA hydratase family protein [SAR86 cluster bacterium]|jgi:enoyl-CoA hydratase|nr:enoyl-CoA hydratase family protein [SAR86 cluster bacterium]